MSATPLGAIQRAVFEVLSGDVTLSAMAGVYDGVPEGAAFPYVVLGEVLATPVNRHDGFGWEVLATLHVWSQFPGFSEALEVADQLSTLLDHQPLAVDGFTHVSTRFDSLQTLRDPDPRIRHVPVSFRIRVET